MLLNVDPFEECQPEEKEVGLKASEAVEITKRDSFIPDLIILQIIMM